MIQEVLPNAGRWTIGTAEARVEQANSRIRMKTFVLSEVRVCPYRHQGGHRGRFLLCFYARLLVLGMVKSALVIGHCFLRLARVPVLQALGSSGVKFGYCSRRGCSHRGVWGQFGLVAGGILEWGARRFLPFDRLALFSVGLLLVLWPLSRITYYNTILCLNAVLSVAGVAQALVRYLAERFRLRPRCGQASREHPEAAGHTWRRGGDAELRHGAKRPCRKFQWAGALAGSWGLLRRLGQFRPWQAASPFQGRPETFRKSPKSPGLPHRTLGCGRERCGNGRVLKEGGGAEHSQPGWRSKLSGGRTCVRHMGARSRGPLLSSICSCRTVQERQARVEQDPHVGCEVRAVQLPRRSGGASPWDDPWPDGSHQQLRSGRGPEPGGAWSSVGLPCRNEGQRLEAASWTGWPEVEDHGPVAPDRPARHQGTGWEGAVRRSGRRGRMPPPGDQSALQQVPLEGRRAGRPGQEGGVRAWLGCVVGSFAPFCVALRSVGGTLWCVGQHEGVAPAFPKIRQP